VRKKRKENTSRGDDDYTFEREVMFFGERGFHLPQIPSNAKLLLCFYYKKKKKRKRRKVRREKRRRIEIEYSYF